MARLGFFIFIYLISSSVSAVIHGEFDDRKYVEDHSDSRLVELSKSVAAMIEVSNIPTFETMEERFNFCSNERFAKDKIVSTCSAVLIEENKILTAAHCVMKKDSCQANFWSFSYMKSGTIPDVNHADSYRCKSILKLEKNYITGIDYAVIELDRVVEGIKPVDMNFKNDLKAEDRVAIIGHPMGLSKIISSNGKILKNSTQDNLYETSLDANAGNSGSPIFNLETYELEGILLKGSYDFDTNFDSDHLCRIWYRCDRYPSEKCLSEDVLKINKVSKEY